MNKQKIYNSIVEVKDIIQTDDDLYNEMIQFMLDDELKRFGHIVWYELGRDSIYKKVAWITVLWCGLFVQSCGNESSFMMPSTRDCMENFRHVMKYIKKGRRLDYTYIDVYGNECTSRLQ